MIAFSPKLHYLDTYTFFARIFDKTTETTEFRRHTFKNFGLASIFDETTGFGTLYARIIFGETTKQQSFGDIQKLTGDA